MISLPWDLCFIGETSLHVPDVIHQVLVLLAHNFGNLVRLLFWLFPLVFSEKQQTDVVVFASLKVSHFLNFSIMTGRFYEWIV
jgi:hypothetical protein